MRCSVVQRERSQGLICALGVERELLSSTSFMSADTSANRGVLKYRSPVSGSRQRILAPFSASAATLSAPAKVAPEVMPTKTAPC